MQDYTGYTVIFDLDGTLIDTAPDLTAALNHVLTGEGRASLPISDVRNLVGHGARALIERGMGSGGTPPSASDTDRMLKLFLSYYGANIASASRPFPGVLDILAQLRDRGALLGICTNKPTALSLALLSALEMQTYFTAILGSDSLPVRKPDPLHLLEAVRQAGGVPGRAVMVGDTGTDIDTARAANIPVVAVSFGYTQIPVRELGPDSVIDQFTDLIDVLPALFRLDRRG